jgi:hypothetical protein
MKIFSGRTKVASGDHATAKSAAAFSLQVACYQRFIFLAAFPLLDHL